MNRLIVTVTLGLALLFQHTLAFADCGNIKDLKSKATQEIQSVVNGQVSNLLLTTDEVTSNVDGKQVRIVIVTYLLNQASNRVGYFRMDPDCNTFIDEIVSMDLPH